MSELARELVQQALDQDYNGANKIFGDLMGDKINDALEQEKIKLANSIYNGVEVDDEDDDDILGDEDGDQLELDLETEDDDEESEEDEEMSDADDDDELEDDDDN